MCRPCPGMMLWPCMQHLMCFKVLPATQRCGACRAWQMREGRMVFTLWGDGTHGRSHGFCMADAAQALLRGRRPRSGHRPEAEAGVGAHRSGPLEGFNSGGASCGVLCATDHACHLQRARATWPLGARAAGGRTCMHACMHADGSPWPAHMVPITITSLRLCDVKQCA